MTASSDRLVAGHPVDRSHFPLLLTLGLGVFTGALDLGVLAPALPALSLSLSIPTNELAWVFTIYLVFNVAGIAIMSILADRYGRRSVYIACITIFALGSVVAVVAPTFAIFLLARAIQAIGAGGIFPVATAAIGDVVPPQRRGAALGLVAATWGLAAVIGPLAGGVVTHFVSWRWIFAANFPLAILVVALARKHLSTIAPHIRERLDWVGLALLLASLWGFSFGLTQNIVPCIVGGAIASVILILWEARAAAPLLPLAIFATRNLAVTYGIELLIGILEGSLFFVPTVLVAAQHMNYAAAGSIAALGALVFVIVIPLAGRALDRFGARAVLRVGATCTALGLAGFAFAFDSLIAAIAAIIVAGVGFGALLGAPTRYLITAEAPERRRATALGLLSQFLIFGQIIGGSVTGGFVKFAGVPLRGFHDAYVAFAIIGALAALLTLFLRDRLV
ncbi:MAG: MFS transporter [Candidatus Eremiobacteraeota bacterium]|nr:MFS transporter [Candidatus Eremiobacteraeota bacterium]